MSAFSRYGVTDEMAFEYQALGTIVFNVGIDIFGQQLIDRYNHIVAYIEYNVPGSKGIGYLKSLKHERT